MTDVKVQPADDRALRVLRLAERVGVVELRQWGDGPNVPGTGTAWWPDVPDAPEHVGLRVGWWPTRYSLGACYDLADRAWPSPGRPVPAALSLAGWLDLARRATRGTPVTSVLTALGDSGDRCRSCRGAGFVAASDWSAECGCRPVGLVAAIDRHQCGPCRGVRAHGEDPWTTPCRCTREARLISAALLYMCSAGPYGADGAE